MYTKLPNGQIIYEEDYSCIIEPQAGKGGIFIGNLEASQNLKTLRKNGIRAVLTAAKGIDLGHAKTDIPFYLQVPGEDRDGFDLTRYFPQAIKFIGDALENTNIMVHCLAGVSRSVCLVLAFFIKCRGMTYDEAYRLVKSKRKIIHPNDGFIAQLRKYEAQVRSQPSESSTKGYSASPSKGYAASPPKSRYEYYISPEKTSSNNYDIYYRRPAYESPTKYDRYQQSPYKKPQQTYEYKYNYDKSFESPAKRRNDTISPKRYELYETRTAEVLQYSDSKRPMMTDIKKLSSFGDYSAKRDEPTYGNPERRVNQYVPRGRSSSDVNVDGSRLVGDYDKLRHTSAAELSEELDNKIAQIRKKYMEYTQNGIRGSRIRDPEPRVNNYFDENDIRLSGGLGMRRITSDYQHPTTGKNSSNDFSIGVMKPGMGSGLGRSSVSGLGLRKLNSMREAY